MPGDALYERIGRTYARTRRPDPRIAAQIDGALGNVRTIVNVGAGTGSYEPTPHDGPARSVVAVEPSEQMISQRPPRCGPAVVGVAEALPLPAMSFDTSLALFTIHHWTDLDQGLREMARVSERQVILMCEPLGTTEFWGLDYWPEIRDLATEARAPRIEDIARNLDIMSVSSVLVPSDCQDGFAAAFWNRPDEYLRVDIQAGMSCLAMLPARARERGAALLHADLDSGRWDIRYGHLRDERSFDGGYRLVTCRGRRTRVHVG